MPAASDELMLVGVVPRMARRMDVAWISFMVGTIGLNRWIEKNGKN
jgi:hypothetical protein